MADGVRLSANAMVNAADVYEATCSNRYSLHNSISVRNRAGTPIADGASKH